MYFSGMIEEERYLLHPNFFPGETGLTPGGIVIVLEAVCESLLERSLLGFLFCGDEDALAEEVARHHISRVSEVKYYKDMFLTSSCVISCILDELVVCVTEIYKARVGINILLLNIQERHINVYYE